MTRVGQDAALQMLGIGPAAKHRFIVVRFQDDQPGLGDRFDGGRRRTTQVRHDGDRTLAGANQESAGVRRVMADRNGHDFNIA